LSKQVVAGSLYPQEVQQYFLVKTICIEGTTTFFSGEKKQVL
jgi:hypothetical protein